MMHIMQDKEREKVSIVRNDQSQHQLTEGVKAAFKAVDKRPVSQMEWTISHPQVQNTTLIPYEYDKYLDASGSPQLDYLLEGATADVFLKTREWFNCRYGLDIDRKDFYELKEMLKRDFKRTVDSMRSLPARGKTQQKRIAELLQELAKMHMLVGQLGCIHCERPGHTQQQCPVLSAFAAKAKSSKHIVFRKIYKVCQDQIAAVKKANEMAEKYAARFDVVLRDQILDHPEDNNIMDGIQAQNAPLANNQAQSHADPPQAQSHADPSQAQAGVPVPPAPARNQLPDAGVGANQAESIRFDQPMLIDDADAGVIDSIDTDGEDGNHAQGNATEEVEVKMKDFPVQADGCYHWAYLLDCVVANANAGGRESWNTKTLTDHMDNDSLMFTPKAPISLNGLKPRDFYSIPMCVANEKANFSIDAGGNVTGLCEVAFAESFEEGFVPAVQWMQHYHQPPIFIVALDQFKRAHEKAYLEIGKQYGEFISRSVSDLEGVLMNLGPGHDCSLMVPGEPAWKAVFILGDLHYRDLLWSQQWHQIGTQSLAENYQFVGFCVWNGLFGSFSFYTVPYWACCLNVSHNPVVCWDNMRAQGDHKHLVVSFMHIFDQVGAKACSTYEKLGRFMTEYFPRTKEYCTVGGDRKCLCGCDNQVGKVNLDEDMFVLPCQCVVPQQCLMNVYQTARDTAARPGFGLCPISETHQAYNQVQLGLIRMLGLKTKFCGTSPSVRSQVDENGMPDGMPTQPDGYSLYCHQTQQEVDSATLLALNRNWWSDLEIGACSKLGTLYTDILTEAENLGPKFQTFGLAIVQSLIK